MKKSLPSNGFTLVELITVVILLAILSTYASSRYFGASSFNSDLLKSELISSLRLTQLRAMHRNGLCNRWGIVQNQAGQVSEDEDEDEDAKCSSTLNQSDSSFVNIANYDATIFLTSTDGSQFIDFDSMGRPRQCDTSIGQCTLTAQPKSGLPFSVCINTQGGIHDC